MPVRRLSKLSKLRKIGIRRGPVKSVFRLGRGLKKLTEKQLRYLFAVVFKKDRRGRVRLGLGRLRSGAEKVKSRVALLIPKPVSRMTPDEALNYAKKVFDKDEAVNIRVIEKAVKGKSIDFVHKNFHASPVEVAYLINDKGKVVHVATGYSPTGTTVAISRKLKGSGFLTGLEDLEQGRKLIKEFKVTTITHNHPYKGVAGFYPPGRRVPLLSATDGSGFVRLILDESQLSVAGRFAPVALDPVKRKRLKFKLSPLREMRAFTDEHYSVFRLKVKGDTIDGDQLYRLSSMFNDYGEKSTSLMLNHNDRIVGKYGMSILESIVDQKVNKKMLEKISPDDFLPEEIEKDFYKALVDSINKYDPNGELIEFKIYTHDGKDVTNTLYK